MKIRKLHLKNIGVFDDEEINFQECPVKDKAEIHILTGENGTGKTTILQSLACLFNFTLINKAVAKLGFYETEISIIRNNYYKKLKPGKSQVTFEIEDENKIELLKFNSNENATTLFGEYSTGSSNVQNELDYFNRLQSSSVINSNETTFVAFAFSGYRQIDDVPVQANYLPTNFKPLVQALDFIKDYLKEGEITINQLVANNISNRALSKEDGSLEEAKKYETVINSIETFIKDVTDYEVKFVLKRSPNELKLRMHAEELDFDVLPDGLRSLISWIADLLGRVDLLKWQDDLPITEKNLILLLDEIEVHLHPAWQRKVLPVVQKLFKNAQIFVSTHSPFVVNSVDDAWVYKLKVEDGKAKVESVERSEDARSYRYVLRNTFDIENEFGIEIENRLKDFYKERDSILGGNGNSKKAKAKLKKIAEELSKQSKELKSKIDFELFQLSEITGEDF